MKAPSYREVAEAERMPGLRLVLSRGIPGPWSVAARAIFDVKGLSFTAVPHDAGMANEDIRRWTGQPSAPAAMLDDERPRAQWSEILLLAEWLRPELAPIPIDEDQRSLMFGICHELCGEDGFGWAARSLLFATQDMAGRIPYPSLLIRYASGRAVDHHRARLNAVVGMLERRLAAQAAAGSGYLVGRALSAADIYRMAFSNLIAPMSKTQCEMPDFYRGIGGLVQTWLDSPIAARLIGHRDFILDNHFETPIAL